MEKEIRGTPVAVKVKPPKFSAKLLLMLKTPIFWRVVFVSLFVLGIGFLVFQNWQTKKQVGDLKTKLSSSEEQIKLAQKQLTESSNSGRDIVEAVRKLIILPPLETPTIATVTDLEKLKGQPFFQNAQVGDKVLIFSESKKAVLYRPSENKVVEVAPLNSATSATPVNPPPTEPAKKK